MKKTTCPSFKEEKKLWENGYEYVLGIDEVGRGAFAGPVVVGAVIFSKNVKISDGINDSKLLSPRNLEKLDKEIRKHAQFYSIAEVGVSIIDKIGIGKATAMAFRKVIAKIVQSCCHAEFNSASPEILKPPKGTCFFEVAQVQDDRKKRFFLLVDGFHIKYIKGIGLKHQKAIIKGDRKSISIAAASIIAKVYRDNLMRSLHKKYPRYHFDINKGYGTKVHQMAIKKHGLSKIHRKSFNLKKFQ